MQTQVISKRHQILSGTGKDRMGEFKDARTPVLAEDHEKAMSDRLRCPRNVRKSCDKTCSSSRDPDRWVGRCCSAARILMSRTHHNTDLDVVLLKKEKKKACHWILDLFERDAEYSVQGCDTFLNHLLKVLFCALLSRLINPICLNQLQKPRNDTELK